MNGNEYSAEDALNLLMAKIRERAESLAVVVQAAIDAGKDASETEPALDRRKKDRVYRKTVAFSHQEALQVAVNALHAYFVEQPLFVDSALDQFKQAAVGVPSQGVVPGDLPKEGVPVVLEYKDQEKRVEIEIQTETQISKTGEPTQPLEKISGNLIEEQELNFARLSELTDTFIE